MTKFKIILLTILFFNCNETTVINAQSFNDTLVKEVSDIPIVEEVREDYKVYKSKTRASYYGKSHHGKRMANGKKYNMYNMTCAHKTLPFGTKIRVTNLKNNKSVTLTVTDRGPFVKNREIDISQAAYNQLTHKQSIGLLDVKLEILNKN